MKCDFCKKNKEVKTVKIEYKGNEKFLFESLVLDFNLCAQCIGENINLIKGFTKVGA